LHWARLLPPLPYQQLVLPQICSPILWPYLYATAKSTASVTDSAASDGIV
jgi:hypothetical protein